MPSNLFHIKFLFRTSLVAVLILAFTAATATAQQTRSYGSLTGYITDPEGLPVPGATVRAESESLMGETVAVTDQKGYYRLLNLPPGVYVIVAELPGFRPVRRENVEMRAGADFRVDLQLEIGGVEETITVTAETPMLDIAKPGQVLNIEGDFQRAVPIQSRKNWSDFLELTPGINARPFDDGSGRMVYFGHAAEHFSHVVQLEGNMTQGYRDAQITYTQMSTDMIEDIQIRSGGVEASAPIGTGLVINIVTKSGGNRLSGSAGYTLQPMSWNGDNSSPGKVNPSTPTIQKINQVDFSLGGPIAKDKVWFFGAGRYAKNQAGISRTGREVQLLQNYGAALFDNIYEGFFPYLKISAQPGRGHSLTAYYQYDRNNYTGDREYHVGQRPPRKTGGSVYGVKLTSLWSSNLTTDMLVTYNNKTSSYQSLEDLESRTPGPGWTLHGDTYISGGLIRGTGRLLASDNYGAVTIGPSSMLVIRGDLTYYLEGGGGSHEFQTGIFAAPRLHRQSTTHYLNDGFITEYRVTREVNDTGSGSIPFYRDVRSPTEVWTNRMKDRDIGVYFQDSWKPNPRLSITAGIRADFIRRYDDIYGIERMKDVAIGPRLGFSYMLTEDARNVLRGSVGRIHEQVNGRDSASSRSVPSTYERWRYYDNNLDGNFETVRYTPPATLGLAQEQYDPNLHQPYTDEFILGFRHQFPGELALDVGYIHRRVKHRYAYFEVNGFWPDNPGEPFGGYGRLDPDRGEFWMLTNADFNTPIYHAIELTVAKRMSHNWQFMGSFNRQWQHMAGTWNPFDRAGYIQPDHFPISRCIEQPRYADDDGYSGGTYCPTWREYSIRTGATYLAPFGIVVTGSLSIQDGPWSGAILTRLDKGDPWIDAYGPSTVVSSTGVSRSNPLNTRTRFKYTHRDDNQVKLPDAKFFHLKIGKEFALGGSHQVEVSLNIFNVLNMGDFQQYTYNGANQDWNPSFLQGRSMQAARAFQLNFNYRF